MKRFLLLAMTVAVMCSCEKSVGYLTGDAAEEGSGTVETPAQAKKFTFTVKGDFTNPEFSDGTRANAYMTADGTEMTDLWVVDYVTSADAEGTVAGTVVQTLHQTSADTDWGKPSMSLTLGTHHVLFLASRGQGAQYQDGIVTWTKPRDTFYLDYEVTVVKTSNGNRAVTLNRCATKLTIGIVDAIPVGTTIISLKPTKWFAGWNMLSGEPVAAPNDYNVTIAIPKSYEGVAGASVSAWSLSGADEWLSDLGIVSKADDAVNAQATITDAPFKANRATNYHGKLYTSDSESSVSLSAEWLASYEGVY